MKRLSFIIITLILQNTMSFAQLAEPLFFKEKIHDFGEILEQQGNADYEFVFTNNSGRPVRIISVQASCGCTTPAWTKEAVAPGKTGFIKASYDPKGRPGYFNKSLTVTTDLSGNPVVLQIKGNVVDRLTVKDETLSAANGNLKLRSSSFNLGKMYINKESAPAEFMVVNEGKDKIEFKEVVSPTYIKVITPVSLKAGERGVIKIQYDARAKKLFGFQSDNIELKTTDTANPTKSFPVYVTIEEFFPPLTIDESAKAPQLMVERSEVNFSRMKQGPVVENTVTIQNKGKKNLEIRYVQSNCTCVVARVDKEVMKPGEAATLTINVITEGRSGTQNKAVTIYSNDPRNPVQRITVTGYIED